MTKPRSGSFSIVSTAAVFDRRLSHADVRVLAALGAHADKKRRCWPAISTIADEANMSKRHARTSMYVGEGCGRDKVEGWLCLIIRPSAKYPISTSI